MWEKISIIWEGFLSFRDIQFYSLLQKLPIEVADAYAEGAEKPEGFDKGVPTSLATSIKLDSEPKTFIAKAWATLLDAKIVDWFKKTLDVGFGIAGLVATGVAFTFASIAGVFVAIGAGFKLGAEFLVNAYHSMKHKASNANLKVIKKFMASNSNAKDLLGMLEKIGKQAADQKRMTAEVKNKDGKLEHKVVERTSDEYKTFTGLRLIPGFVKAFVNPKGVDAVIVADKFPRTWKFMRYTFWRFLPEVALLGTAIALGAPVVAIAFGTLFLVAGNTLRTLSLFGKSEQYFAANAIVKGAEIVNTLKEGQTQVIDGLAYKVEDLKDNRIIITADDANDTSKNKHFAFTVPGQIIDLTTSFESGRKIGESYRASEFFKNVADYARTAF